MSEATATIKVDDVKERKSKKGKTFWIIVDGNDDAYYAWEKAQAELAEKAKAEGYAIKVEYEEDNGYKTAREISGPVKSDEPPALGTGEYVKGQTAPNDKRSIAASVALKAAVDSVTHTIPMDATAKTASEKVIPLADFYFLWLTGKAGIQEPDDIPF